MMFKKSVPVLVLVFAVIFPAFGQKDTIRIFQYNLLNYGDNDNPASYKDPRLSAIVQYANPDIIGVNEIANSPSLSQNIKDNVLGAGWEKAAFVNTGNEIQTNMLFWRADKFALKFQKTISYKLRDIIAYNLYYKDAQLGQTKDTVFLTIIVAHLKAGNTTQDKNDRAGETQTVVNYLNSLGTNGNYIFMGDLNLYTSSETAYSNLINNPNAAGKLYDPINRPGNWSANSTFADIHTQSTRTSGMPDGGATGGLDDRFDHIMVSNEILNDGKGCMYIQGSYKALGQDGKHFNKSVTSSPSNPDVPFNVIQSLYEMSDHLPVYADFEIHSSLPGTEVNGIATYLKGINVVNPFNGKLIFIGLNNPANDMFISVCTIDGRILFSKQKLRGASINVPSDWQPGLYMLRMEDARGNVVTKKIIKK